MPQLLINKPNRLQQSRTALVMAFTLSLAACGGGAETFGNDGDINRAPVANAGSDQNVDEMSTVNLSGSGSDADNDRLTFSWTQTAGAIVTINNSDMATASFTAPNVAVDSPEVLTFQLTVNDGAANGTDLVSITVAEPPASVTGTVNFEFVPPNPVCRGLDFDSTFVKPIRGATVQLIDAGTSAVLATTQSDDNGNYSFAHINADTMVRLRVRAELRKTTGNSRWDVEVRDNYDISASPPALGSRPLYVVEGSNFDTGSAGVVVQDMTARTGWDGASYTGNRSAAPFSILDAIYTTMKFIESVDPDVFFPPLDAFWSVNNTSSVSSETGRDTGELGGSFYDVGRDRLFLVGEAATDTEEFDDHVIVHEWGHYFEDNLSRSDSFGGPHSVGNLLDPRVAFGEGWATALAGMALNDHLYCDTGAAGSTSGFGIGAESGSYDASGWYDEISVIRFIYDLFDTDDEGGDPGSIGFAPIYAVMTGPHASTDAFTTIFSFAYELRRTLDPAGQALLDSQLVREDMTPEFDQWGVGEANTAGGAQDVIPIYTDIVADGSALPICVNSQFDSGRDGNKLTENRFLRITVPLTDQYDVTMTTTTPTPVTPDTADHDQSDPDMYIYNGPLYVVEGSSPDENSETFRTPTLQAGTTYIAAIEDWRFDDELAATGYPDRICFDVTFASTP